MFFANVYLFSFNFFNLRNKGQIERGMRQRNFYTIEDDDKWIKKSCPLI